MINKHTCEVARKLNNPFKFLEVSVCKTATQKKALLFGAYLENVLFYISMIKSALIFMLSSQERKEKYFLHHIRSSFSSLGLCQHAEHSHLFHTTHLFLTAYFLSHAHQFSLDYSAIQPTSSSLVHDLQETQKGTGRTCKLHHRQLPRLVSNLKLKLAEMLVVAPWLCSIFAQKLSANSDAEG